ncbi:Erythromycin esterase homolog [Myroides marinus]|uniref:Erythromycin esterase homolog n=1 Tax=Myroides marinus TaxID=703342 RepID=A0A1H6UXH4_9FLAO|nr:erythromycin esterase family protein [Myroides marinus]MDM1347437.1 erythromycin esterase family protein [Myroides marinus]MDM1404844.1 erythromycin esterase family protein [Myroides marinus]SEI97089.1 Erythromycin esterase homolog [Myroides marinus]
MKPYSTLYLKYFLFTLFSLFISAINYAQDSILINDIKDKQIVALGDASHSDYTSSLLRVELIKKLIEEHNFKSIVLESNLFEVYQAFEQYKITNSIETINDAIFLVMRNEALNDLFMYLKEQNDLGNPIKVFGFDSSFSATDSNTVFINAIKENTNYNNLNCSDISDSEFAKHFKMLTHTNLKALLRSKKDYNVVYNYLMCQLQKNNSHSIINQALSNITKTIQARYDKVDSDNFRDQLMYENIVFLKKLYPNEKMILFGSSTHFIKTPKAIESSFMQNNRITLGALLTKHFSDQYSFIAYTAINGNSLGFYKKKYKLKQAPQGSIENTVALSPNTIYLNKQSTLLQTAKSSRLLGNTFINMNINEVVDGLVLIKDNNL